MSTHDLDDLCREVALAIVRNDLGRIVELRAEVGRRSRRGLPIADVTRARLFALDAVLDHAETAVRMRRERHVVGGRKGGKTAAMDAIVEMLRERDPEMLGVEPILYGLDEA